MKKLKKLKKIPVFKNEEEERDFWDTHSVVDYLDMNNSVMVAFPNLKPSSQTISLRLPQWLLYDIKREANKRDVPYQSLIKVFLAEKVMEEEKKSILS